MAENCSTCHQPIRDGEGQSCKADGTRFHLRASDCVAAVVRRYAEITDESASKQRKLERETQFEDNYAHGVAADVAEEIAAAIRAEFPEVRG
jgi:hypothetical protein